MGESLCRIGLSLGLVLLIFSLFALSLVKPDTPEFVAAVLSTLANLITVVGCGLLLRYLISRRNKNP
jgi:hypothetical protein